MFWRGPCTRSVSPNRSGRSTSPVRRGRPSRRMARTERLNFSRNWISDSVAPTNRERGESSTSAMPTISDCRSLSSTPTSGCTSSRPLTSAQTRLSTMPSMSNTSPRSRMVSFTGARMILPCLSRPMTDNSKSWRKSLSANLRPMSGEPAGTRARKRRSSRW